MSVLDLQGLTTEMEGGGGHGGGGGGGGGGGSTLDGAGLRVQTRSNLSLVLCH